MATKPKGDPSKSLFGDDDLLDSLFDDKELPVRGRATRNKQLTHTDNIFSMLGEEVKRDGGDTEDSDVSAADLNDILKDMMDIDDMDNHLLASKKNPSSAPAQTKKDSPTLESKVKPEGADSGDDDEGVGQTPYTKAKVAKKQSELTFDDDKDDMMDVLGFDNDKNGGKKNELWSNKERSAPPQKRRTALDEILQNLASPRPLERPPIGERKDQPQSQEKQQHEKTSSVKEPPLEDDLIFGSYQPTLGSTPEGHQSRRQSVRFSTEDVSLSTPEKKPKPTTPVSTRQRGTADWLGLKTNNDFAFLEGDNKETSKESPKAPSSPSLERRPSLTRSHTTSVAKTAVDTHTLTNNITKQTKPEVSKRHQKEEEEEEEDDWLAGALSRKKALSVPKTSKQGDSLDLGDDLGSTISKQVTSQAPWGKEDILTSVKETSSTFLGKPSPTALVRETRTKKDTIFSRPSTLPQSPSFITEHTPATQPHLPSTLTSSSATALHAKVDLRQTLYSSHPSDCPPQLAGTLPASAASISHTQPQPQSQPQHHLSSHEGSRVPTQALDETTQQLPLLNPVSTMLPGSMWSDPQQMQNTSAAVQQQVTLLADSLQQLLLQQQMMQSQLLGLGGVVDAGVLQRQQQSGDYQALQTRIIQLEGQVKSLQLERAQSQMLLENVQQRHKQDMELIESTHKARVKLLEESAAQRDTETRQEYEDLMERLAAMTQSAEQERSELQARYQRKLDQAQQDRDREVERLRDLQRKSILELKKDYEDQVQRLKKLKEEEIDAVTSATSQTRSLTVVIEQMEQVSSRLGDLSSRVESTHEHTAHGLEQEARHRDEQLQIMQDRLAQQQKAMAEERACFKEIISRMDTQVNEQQRQLEKERWKVTAEQAKAQSTQRGLEGDRHALSLQINMEREELERAKSALLEEQKSVMQQCAEERRKLAADWTHFHNLEKQRRERAEQEVSSLLEKREGSIISLAQEQADLKLHTAELKQKQAAVAQERETLERLREELDREKDRISSKALRLQTRAQEVEAFSKIAADKYEEGKRALQEAKRVEAEHEARLRNIHTQTERLRQHEQRILKEEIRLNNIKKDTEKLRVNAPITSSPPVIPHILPDAGSVLPNPELSSTLNVPLPTSFASQSMDLQAFIALWKYTAAKDDEYLQEESIFLENLKKSRSYFNKD